MSPRRGVAVQRRCHANRRARTLLDSCALLLTSIRFTSKPHLHSSTTSRHRIERQDAIELARRRHPPPHIQMPLQAPPGHGSARRAGGYSKKAQLILSRSEEWQLSMPFICNNDDSDSVRSGFAWDSTTPVQVWGRSNDLVSRRHLLVAIAQQTRIQRQPNLL